MTEYKYDARIPSCQLDIESLNEIGGIIENEIQEIKKTKEEQNTNFDLTIRGETKEIIEHDTKNILTIKFPQKLKKIEFNFTVYGSFQKQINVEIPIDLSWSKPTVTVKELDEKWVNGIAGLIMDIFERRKNHNHVFRERKTALPLVIVLGIVSTIAVEKSILQIIYQALSQEYSFSWGVFFGAVWIVIAAWYWFLEWLFPRIEFEDYQNQVKIRKKIISILGLIIGGLIVNGVYDYFVR